MGLNETLQGPSKVFTVLTGVKLASPSTNQAVQEMMSRANSQDNVRLIKAPVKGESFGEWAEKVLNETGLETGVEINPVNEKLYLLKHLSGSSEIYFFSSQDELNGIACTAK